MVHKPAPACPSCGYIYEIQARAPEEKDGELEKVSSAEREARRREINRAAAQARTLEDLYEVAKQYGYKKGWAWFRWQARQRKVTA